MEGRGVKFNTDRRRGLDFFSHHFSNVLKQRFYLDNIKL